MRPNRHRQRLSIGLLTASYAVAIAACASSSPQRTGSGGATTATGNASPIGLSRCMRSNGVPRFPDPTMGSGGEGFTGLGRSIDGTLIVDGITFSGPAVHAAEKACRRYLVPTGPPPMLSESQKQAAIAHAQCIRRHGVPSFPDPTFPADGGIAVRLGAGLSPQSPALQTAQKACGGVGNRVLP